MNIATLGKCLMAMSVMGLSSMGGTAHAGPNGWTADLSVAGGLSYVPPSSGGCSSGCRTYRVTVSHIGDDEARFVRVFLYSGANVLTAASVVSPVAGGSCSISSVFGAGYYAECTLSGALGSIPNAGSATFDFNVTASGTIDVAAMVFSIVPDTDGTGASKTGNNYVYGNM